ncbi:MAG: hypothetical protein ACRDD7_14475, partial [Peptostreptococcaceae bacterium]
NGKNNFKLKIKKIIENPFSYSIWVYNNKFSLIELEVSKDKIKENDEYIYVSFDEDKICLFD